MITVLSYDFQGKRKVNVYIVCPKCGKVGKIIASKRNKLGKRKYSVLHKDGNKCHFSWINGDIWERINDLYLKLRR